MRFLEAKAGKEEAEAGLEAKEEEESSVRVERRGKRGEGEEEGEFFFLVGGFSLVWSRACF